MPASEKILQKLHDIRQDLGDPDFGNIVEEIVQLTRKSAAAESMLQCYKKLRDSGHLPAPACVFLLAIALEPCANRIIDELCESIEDERRQARMDLYDELIETIRAFVEKRPMPLEDIRTTFEDLLELEADLASEVKAESFPSGKFPEEEKVRILAQQFRDVGEQELAVLVENTPLTFQRLREHRLRSFRSPAKSRSCRAAVLRAGMYERILLSTIEPCQMGHCVK